mmetsp:Transcript_9047/g.28232  ORF Transcript_9047/g.28232 Transcript_9047/m.28232 type:complete len:649 (+) Transcript_9047:1-1947(+)
MASGASDPAAASIFVSVASYRDNQCQYTLQDLFRKAAHPERVVAGVCFQVAKEDEDSFLLDLGEWSSQIRTYFLHHTEAMGPCYARSLIQRELYKGEDYYFQIDSHFRFVQGWDELCLEQLGRCESPKPILTAYASSYTLPKDYKPGEPDQAILAANKAVTIICADTFGDQNRDDPFLRIKTRNCRSDFGHVPPPAIFWTARFAFSRGSVVHEVPYDPHLEYIFFGEEIAMSARLWTSGWDLFNPTRNIAYHLGSRAHRHWFREVQASPEQVQREAAAKHRICGLLGTPWPNGQRHPPPAAPYGLGTARSLGEYERFAGVDFEFQAVWDRAKCGGLSKELFPPQWAEEEREKMMQAAQLSDVASWAGKGNAGALERQFPEAAAAATTAKAPRQASPNPEAERARELTRMRIQAFQARLHGGQEDQAHEAELELSRAFAGLGRLEAAEGDEQRAGDAFGRALEHAEAARERAPSSLCSDPSWTGPVAQARAAAQMGLRRHADAKATLREALALTAELLAERPDEEAEQLVLDVVEGIHSAHEQTDDRKGLEAFVRPLQGLLGTLQRMTAEGPEAAASLASAPERPPEGGALSLRARLLERVVLVCIATGRDRDMEVAKRVFTGFRVARESPNLVRLLGMLQSSGTFLDL